MSADDYLPQQNERERLFWRLWLASVALIVGRTFLSSLVARTLTGQRRLWQKDARHTLPVPMKKLLPILLAALALAALPTVAPAALLITQSGSNVVVSGSGSLITTGLSLLDTGNVTGGINPSQGLIRLSSTAAATAAVYSAAFSGSSNFGTGGGIAPTSGTGTLEGFVGTGALYVPAGYTSGTTLMGTSTYASATFTSLGITAGNYTFNYSATAGGAVLDTITVQAAVPEPSTWALLGIGAVGAGAVAKRRRSRSCA